MDSTLLKIHSKLKLVLILSLYPKEVAPALEYVLTGSEEALRNLVEEEEKNKQTDYLISFPGFPGCPTAIKHFEEFRRMGLDNDQIVRLNLILHFRNSVLLAYHRYLHNNDTDALQEAYDQLKEHLWVE